MWRKTIFDVVVLLVNNDEGAILRYKRQVIRDKRIRRELLLLYVLLTLSPGSNHQLNHQRLQSLHLT